MARVNVYLPDALATEARAAGLNVSKLTQDAVLAAVSADQTSAWLASVAQLGATGVGHEDVLAAVREAKGELERLG